MAKFIAICGAVYSSCGKGATASSIGLLLKLRGHSVQYLKLDGYVMPLASSTLSPDQHGECYINSNSTNSEYGEIIEVDQDHGTWDRIVCSAGDKSLSNECTAKNIMTSGSLYKEVIKRQERGDYGGKTVQQSPHITDLIIARFIELGKETDVVIIEIGGTVGDSESFAFFEALRQFKQKYQNNVMVALVAPVLWVPTIQEFKTKPLQNGVRELQHYGLPLDVLFCRTDRDVPESIFEKITNLIGIERNRIFEAKDVDFLYKIPIEFYNRQVDDFFVDLFRLNRSPCRIQKYRETVEKYNSDLPIVKIGIVGKYDHKDAYISIKEALLHAGLANDVKVEVRFIKAEDLEKYQDNRGLHKHFEDIHGAIVAGGFGVRGCSGKVKACNYIREKKIPFLGICLGLQVAIIEFARNVLNLEDANSLEFDEKTTNPVVHFVEGQKDIKKVAGTMRLGGYDCELTKNSLTFDLYKKKVINERHRHRYEINDKYIPLLAEKGFKVTGINPGSNLVEIMELDKDIHPYYIGTQFHGEFKSRLTTPAPLFSGLIAAAIAKKAEQPIEKTE